MFLDRLTALKWQIAAGAGAAISIGLSVALLTAKIEIRHLTKVNDGLTVDLTQSKANVATLESAIATQNAALEQMGRDAAAAVALSEARVEAANVARKQAERRAAALLADKPRGETLEERVLDVDARIMEALK